MTIRGARVALMLSWPFLCLSGIYLVCVFQKPRHILKEPYHAMSAGTLPELETASPAYFVRGSEQPMELPPVRESPPSPLLPPPALALPETSAPTLAAAPSSLP